MSKKLPSFFNRKMLPQAVAVLVLGCAGIFFVLQQDVGYMTPMNVTQRVAAEVRVASEVPANSDNVVVENTSEINESTEQIIPADVNASTVVDQKVVSADKIYLAKSLANTEYGALNEEVIDAVDSGIESRLNTMMAKGYPINASDNAGETALLKAAMNGDEQICRALLDLGADVLIASDNGNTPLLAASMSGNLAVVSLLLEAGAPPDAQMLDGRSALMVTAWSDFPQITRLLLEYGASPDLIDNDQRNALFYALWDSNIEVVKLLLAKGADVKLIDNRGQSAIDIAKIRQIDLATLEAEIANTPSQ